MKRLSIGVNFTVFLLFFGIAMLEAFQSRNWINVALWLAIGTAFLLADNLKRAVTGPFKDMETSLLHSGAGHRGKDRPSKD